jgi:hypothetical protein
MFGDRTQVEIIDRNGATLAEICDTKENVAAQLIEIIQKTQKSTSR